MLGFFWNAFAFIIALGILVTIHEYGHFWVARRLGFKVLRFSVGFGQPLWKHVGKDGVEYVVAAIPLGGYVKMLDAREGSVDPGDAAGEFMRQPVLHRIAVLIAGPAANFLFAIVALWLMLLLGVSELRSITGDIKPNSIAARAGLAAEMEIIAIDGKPTKTWREVQLALIDRLGEKSSMDMALRDKQGNDHRKTLQLGAWEVDTKKPNVLGSLGLSPYVPKMPAIVAGVQKDSAAARAGLMEGDEIIQIDEHLIDNWAELVKIVHQSAGQTLSLTIIRDGVQKIIEAQPETKKTNDGQKQGMLGISGKMPNMPDSYVLKVHYGIVDALLEAARRTWNLTALTFNGIKKLVTGQLSLDTLSGPISIAQGAGMTASYGLQAFLSFLAMVSVNLGLINLLPIPVLDGGHLMFYLIEWIKGKPVPEAVQEVGLRIGLGIILSLMFIALYYDILRLQH